MSPELTLALTVLIYVVIGGFLLSLLFWLIGATFAARNIRKLQKSMKHDFMSTDFSKRR